MTEKELRIELAFRRIEDLERTTRGLKEDLVMITNPQSIDNIDDDIDLDKD